jgi:serine/threonine protein phosphatase PrpC
MADWQVEIGQKSETGRVRKHNEDYVEYFVPTDEAQLHSKGCFFAVADGMGGHRAGEVASQEAVKRVIEAYYADTTSDVGDSLIAAFEQANKDIFDLAQADLSKAGMGTTLVAAVLLGRKVTIANVGDSRAYLLRRKRLRQITVDHSWVEAQIQAGILTRDQAETHPQKNLITRALGTRPSVDIDLFETELCKGDIFLLCTDGLSGQVGDEGLAHSIRSLPPAQAAADLVEQANAHGGRDNVSVVVVQAGSHREAAGLQGIFDASWLQGLRPVLHRSSLGTAPGRPAPALAVSRRRGRLVAGLLALIVVCLCALVISFPVVNQRFVGNPVAAPELAPIRFVDLDPDDLAPLAGYLNYSTLSDMEAAHPGQLDSESPIMVDLQPANSGLFLVGQVRDWQCQGQMCTFRLDMAGEMYGAQLDQSFFSELPLDLDGRRVRLFGFQSRDGQTVDTRLLDLGERWWVWWQPAWATVYDNTNWEDEVWVYSIADHNPYSTIEMAQYPTLKQGEHILTKGRWLETGPGNSMTFAVESAYRLQEGVYRSLSDEPILLPMPTVTIRLTVEH